MTDIAEIKTVLEEKFPSIKIEERFYVLVKDEDEEQYDRVMAKHIVVEYNKRIYFFSGTSENHGEVNDEGKVLTIYLQEILEGDPYPKTMIDVISRRINEDLKCEM